MTVTRAHDFDIVMICDFRFPGGTSSCIAEEIKSQAARGYRTALMQIPAPALRKFRPFNPRIMACVQAGMATVIPADRPVSTRLLLLHHPMVFTVYPDLRPVVRAEVTRLIVHQPPVDEAQEYYDVRQVSEVTTQLFGDGIEWAPVGPAARQTLRDAPGITLTAEDWFNLIDVDAWSADRTRPIGSPPVIGRHGRPDWKKWPASAEEILAAYPDADDVRVRVLGGGEVAREMLGRVPANWELLPFGTVDPRRFLAGIDFFVYFHHPAWIEAFGRTVLEALASGCPVIVAPSFEETFHDACLYAEPAGVRPIVDELVRDRAAYLEQVDRGRTAVRRLYGLESHGRRIASLIGAPEATPAVSPAHRDATRRRVIFFTSNGEGMGHLTRMMAIARRAPDDIEPIFVTMSSGLSVLRQAGFFAEYIPRPPDWHWSVWNPLLERRLVEIMGRYEAEVLVFDGNAPYQGLAEARRATGHTFIWVRRAMWRPDTNAAFIERSANFDLIIEPGELAEANDCGPTAEQRDRVSCVRPIVLLDDDEVLDRADARRELGLAPDTRAVLLQLGSDNTNDVASPAWVTASRLLREPDTEVVVAEWLISRRRLDLPEGVKRIRLYPLTRYVRAFDFAVSAAGYNSFHELIAFGLPTIFVPMPKPSEDQSGRTRWAADEACAINLQPFSEGGLEEAVAVMLDDERRSAMSAQCRVVFPGNGARDAMDIITRTAIPDRDPATPEITITTTNSGITQPA